MAGGATSALGTLAIVESIKHDGGSFVDRCTLVGDADYATNGTSGLQAALRALRKSPHLDLVSVVDEGVQAGHYLVYDHAADKLVAFVRTTGVEAAAGTDLHATTFVLVIASY
jgi:hypothetical protein